MARINKYEVDSSISANDILIGTDGDPGMGLATKNFSIEDIATYIGSTLEFVETVTGNIVDNTDPLNPVINYTAADNLQKVVTSTGYVVTNADNNYTIFINSSSPVDIILTGGSLSMPNFECNFYNIGTGLVFFVNTGDISVGYPDGFFLATDKVCNLIGFMATTIYRLKGELTT